MPSYEELASTQYGVPQNFQEFVQALQEPARYLPWLRMLGLSQPMQPEASPHAIGPILTGRNMPPAQVPQMYQNSLVSRLYQPNNNGILYR